MRNQSGERKRCHELAVSDDFVGHQRMQAENWECLHVSKNAAKTEQGRGELGFVSWRLGWFDSRRLHYHFNQMGMFCLWCPNGFPLGLHRERRDLIEQPNGGDCARVAIPLIRRLARVG